MPVLLSLTSYVLLTCAAIAYNQHISTLSLFSTLSKILVPGSAKEGLAPTSCWRTLLIANEWSELASSRYSSPEATLVVIIVAMEGFK